MKRTTTATVRLMKQEPPVVRCTTRMPMVMDSGSLLVLDVCARHLENIRQQRQVTVVTPMQSLSGVQGWFSTTNMCGNFDYNCDQRAETQTGQGSCVWTGHACLTQTGFENAVPACGQSGNYITDCVDTGSGCRANTRTRVQGCR